VASLPGDAACADLASAGGLVAAGLSGDGGLQVLHRGDVPANGPSQPGPHRAQTARVPERDLKRYFLHVQRAAPPRRLPLPPGPAPAELGVGQVPAHRNPEVVAQLFGEDADVGHRSVLLGKLGEEAAQFLERLRREAMTGMALLKALRPQAVAFRVYRD